jgi:predicted RNA methylase
MANEQRFTGRANDYVRARPSYPPEVLETLTREFGLGAGQQVADLGAGTGILTAMLLELGCTVYAVEPNQAMALAAAKTLGGNPRFIDVRASAEATRLA